MAQLVEHVGHLLAYVVRTPTTSRPAFAGLASIRRLVSSRVSDTEGV
jgi:hypothetical protein